MGFAPNLPIHKGTVLGDRYEVGATVEGERHVFRGTDRRGGAPVSIRASWRIDHDRKALARLERLADPHIARILAAGEQAGASYFVTESLDGYFLGDELHAGALSLGRVLAVGARICDAVAVLHAHDLVHGELTTRTVYVGWPSSADDSDAHQVKLAPPVIIRAPSPEAIAADVAASRELITAMLEPDVPAVRRELADATLTMASQLAQRCRALLHELPEDQRSTVARRLPVPQPTWDGPRPTNWTPPPTPRDFAYKPGATPPPAPASEPESPPPQAIVVDRSPRRSAAVAIAVAVLVAIAALLWWRA